VGSGIRRKNVLDAFARRGLPRIVPRRERARAVIAETFRMGGHATTTNAKPAKRFRRAVYHMGQRDPVGMYEEYLK